MVLPFVSVLTPTYNRKEFVKSMVACYKAQTYSHDRMEWIVLDDGTDSMETDFLAETKGLPNIRYIREPTKQTIGAKRNRLHREARGEIFISWDDDDYYCPERVAYAVKRLTASPGYQLAGSSLLYLYFKEKKKIISIGPYHERHATNGTFAIKAEYAKTHMYDESVLFAEEKSFLENYKHPMIQLDPFKVMLVMCHSENTFNKNKLLDEPNPLVKQTNLKLKDFIKDSKIRALFEKKV